MATQSNNPLSGDMKRDLAFVTAIYDAGLRQAVLYYVDRTAPKEALADAFQKVRGLCVQATDKEITMALAECWALCKRRSEDEDDTTLTLAALRNRIKPYPADVVLDVLRQWPDKNRFTPSWAELSEKLNALSHHRKRMLTALKELTVP